jgi:hypothetical protein
VLVVLLKHCSDSVFFAAVLLDFRHFAIATNAGVCAARLSPTDESEPQQNWREK